MKTVSKLTKPCAKCGEPVTRYPSQFLGTLVYCSKICQNADIARRFSGVNNRNWKGGRVTETHKGYVLIRKPDHPRARKGGYVLEHILVMEAVLQRPLKPGERIHHINDDPADNCPENLKLYASNSEHLRAEGHYVPQAPPCRCGRPHKGRGLCARHLAQKRRTGRSWDFESKTARANLPKTCLYSECNEPTRARGLCGRHYQQMRTAGRLDEFYPSSEVAL